MKCRKRGFISRIFALILLPSLLGPFTSLEPRELEFSLIPPMETSLMPRWASLVVSPLMESTNPQMRG